MGLLHCCGGALLTKHCTWLASPHSSRQHAYSSTPFKLTAASLSSILLRCCVHTCDFTRAVIKHGEKNWSAVARTFNELMGRHPLLGRAPKQCRSRYLQQLVPGIKTGEWSVEEEEILVEGHRQFGNQWTLIASMLPGRTETSVKNHYNCTARRWGVPAERASTCCC